VYHSISVYWKQREALFIQFIENQRSLHVSSITCPSSGGSAQKAFGILRACNVSWLWHVSLQPCHCQLTLYASNIPNAVCTEAPEDEQVMLETCRRPWFSVNWMKKCITFVSVYWSHNNFYLMLVDKWSVYNFKGPTAVIHYYLNQTNSFARQSCFCFTSYKAILDQMQPF
jgi:hypothetical protein